MSGTLLLCCVWIAELQPAGTPASEAACVTSRIEELGGARVLEDLSDDLEGWQRVLDGVATGQGEWLAVGRELRRAARSDESSELLDLALAEALAPAAERVLEIADGSVWQVDDACSSIGFAERGPSDGSYIARFLDARRAAVEAVARPELAERRDRCLAELEALQEYLLGREHAGR